MSTGPLTDDAFAIVLLCSRVALPKGAARRDGTRHGPLTTAEWGKFAESLRDSPWKRPAALLGRTAEELEATLGVTSPLAERLATLLERVGQASIELERLSSVGLWIVTRADDHYPSKLKRRLKRQAPPVLFGAGRPELLDLQGMAIVGSREIEADDEQFAAEAGAGCATGGLAVFSGGARGVDRTAMFAAIGADGQAIGVLSDSLERLSRERDHRTALQAGSLTLVSAIHPGAGFDVGNAMARNRLVYCLADYALVVASGSRQGGTWAGATEDLRHGWVPLFVRNGANASEGNRALVQLGGIPMTTFPRVDGELASWLSDHSDGIRQQRQEPVQQVELRITSGLRDQEVVENAKENRHQETVSSGLRSDDTRHALFDGEIQGARASYPPADSPADGPIRKAVDLFELCWPVLAEHLATPSSLEEIAQRTKIERTQAKVWLQRAVEGGLAEKLGRPVRYRLPRPVSRSLLDVQ